MKRNKITNLAGPDTNPLVKELSGYVELGMKRQAFQLSRKIFAMPRIQPDEFFEAMNTLCTMGSTSELRRWRPLVESAYARQSANGRRKMKGDMLRYYCSLKDWESALPYLTSAEKKNAVNAVWVMDLLLETKRMEEAKRLARNCETLLRKKRDSFTFALLIDALAVYCAWMGDLDNALNLWQHAPLEEPCRQNALGGIVRIHLARALKGIRNGLQSVQLLKKTPDQETALIIPGNDEAMNMEAEKELMKYKRGIEKLLPLSSRMRLGFSD